LSNRPRAVIMALPTQSHHWFGEHWAYSEHDRSNTSPSFSPVRLKNLA